MTPLVDHEFVALKALKVKLEEKEVHTELLKSQLDPLASGLPPNLTRTENVILRSLWSGLGVEQAVRAISDFLKEASRFCKCGNPDTADHALW